MLFECRILAPRFLASLVVISAGCTKVASPAVEPPPLVSNTAPANFREVDKAKLLGATVASGTFVRIVGIHEKDGYFVDAQELRGTVCVVLNQDGQGELKTSEDGYYSGSLGCDTDIQFYFYAVALEPAQRSSFHSDPTQFDEPE